jgi:hypothetical protein
VRAKAGFFGTVDSAQLCLIGVQLSPVSADYLVVGYAANDTTEGGHAEVRGEVPVDELAHRVQFLLGGGEACLQAGDLWIIPMNFQSSPGRTASIRSPSNATDHPLLWT